MKPVIVVLFVDALGWRLASAATGWAPELPERRALDTILGFSSGALPTAFTGRLPRDHGRWLMYRRAANGATPFAGFGWLRALPPRVRHSRRLGSALTALVARRGVRGYFNLYDVPREELAAFDLAERDDLFAPGGLPGDSLWDALERRGARWRGWNWRTPEAEALAQALERLERDGDDLLFVYTADLDALLHREGSRGARVRERLALYADWIAAAFAAAARRGRPLWCYVASDHGMVDVTASVDVMGRVAALPWRRGRDYLAFYDSTMARFWWRDEGARRAVRAALEAEPRGRWLAPADLARAGADFADRRYGEDVFLLEPGALLVPSFMGAGTLAAMHGYDPSHPDMPGLLASNRPLPPGVTHLVHLRAFLEAELDAAGTAA